ncbi:MAG TPA: PilZ domain-containing protein [Kofleriaceae bacterium]|nr:PilZ domain-containing protein [Kofleriaceae bacterium]
MSRRAPRYRISLNVTVMPLLGGKMAVCHTRDVSDVGICLDTSEVSEWLPVGTRVSLALTDPRSGTAMEVIGDVVREVAGSNPALGVLLIEPPPEWKVLVTNAARQSGTVEKPGRRMRVLVVGDDHRQRGAMALYVSSGWDVLFASDDFAVHEALENIKLDAVIAELDAADPRIQPIMDDVRKQQPAARRIVRGLGRSDDDLVHRYVDRDSGLDALLDAVTANIAAP